MTLDHFDIRIQNELYKFIEEHKRDYPDISDEPMAYWLEAFMNKLDELDLDDGT